MPALNSQQQCSPLQSLVDQLPKGRVSEDPSYRAAFESDGLTAFRKRPLGVVIPENQDEVVQTVRWCVQNNVPFVARGSGTSLSGGSMPVANGIVISLNKLRQIIKLDPENRIAVVEPGVINLHVSQASAPHGLYYAPDPSSQKICTIGGNIAFNSGGAHCLKYGMTSNHVIGMKVVTASGEIAEFGSESIESIGADMTGLFVGSEGLFGIALEITLRLIPLPERFHTVLVGYHSLRDAGDAVSAVIDSGLLPGAMEIMESLAIEAAEAATACGYPKGAEAALIVELEGPRERLEIEKQQLRDVIAKTNAFETVVAADDAQRNAIWAGRKSAFSAVGKLSPDFLVQDGVVPRKRLGEALVQIQKFSQESGLRCANVFHAGDGNLHPLILFDDSVPGQLEQAEALAGKILTLCVQMGGSITGEHGVGIEKRDYLSQMYDDDSMATMHRIRGAFDPKNLANPGKMFPGGPPESVGMAVRSQSGGRAPDSFPVEVQSPQELRQAITDFDQVLVVGNQTKRPLSVAKDTQLISTRSMSGVTEYEPSEFTFSALAGTTLAEIVNLLETRRQYLPFDPLLVDKNATIAGTLAAGISGPGRHRYGGLRDFILGATYIDGTGTVIKSGGRVVKNAAGFDLPKLFVGSCGRLAALTELTFKVFPQPPAFHSYRIRCADHETALSVVATLARGRWELDAIDYDSANCTVWIRIGAMRPVADLLVADIEGSLPSQATQIELVADENELPWRSLSRLEGLNRDDQLVIKIPMSIRLATSMADWCDSEPKSAHLHVSCAGAIGWLAIESSRLDELDRKLCDEQATGLVVQDSQGVAKKPVIGFSRTQPIELEVKQAIDQVQRFPGLVY
ncbi:FAD-binding protein [Stieleria sp. JC731]|uniref:FAD-binding oxidoreductase n=1 Tax=Pirellulaceae TaxID=2691357 RepID=UPI001E5EFDC6|nr:FAD-linked oxidase C-terminal domain-containing protein [Stieleria sp. JC731]MCC9602486.1 FAD-binding protein [Stieleria sp. JC731]